MKPVLGFSGGIHLAGTNLNLDAPSSRRVSVITHASVKGLRKKAQVVITPQMLAVTGRHKQLKVLPLNFGKAMGLGKIELKLYPSGFSKGSSIVLIHVDGVRYLYAAFLGMDQRRSTAEVPKVPRADVLIVRNAGGAFHNKNLSAIRAIRHVMPQIEQSLSVHNCALVLTPMHQDAVELALALRGTGLRVLLHKSILHFAQKLGMPGFNSVRVAPGQRHRSAVVLWPACLAESPVIAGFSGPRFYLPGSTGDIEVPFSGMIDPWRLVKLARLSQAGQVAVIGALSQKAESMLKKAGIAFHTCMPPAQPDLPF